MTKYILSVTAADDSKLPSDGEIEIALEQAFFPHIFSIYDHKEN